MSVLTLVFALALSSGLINGQTTKVPRDTTTTAPPTTTTPAATTTPTATEAPEEEDPGYSVVHRFSSSIGTADADTIARLLLNPPGVLT